MVTDGDMKGHPVHYVKYHVVISRMYDIISHLIISLYDISPEASLGRLQSGLCQNNSLT